MTDNTPEGDGPPLSFKKVDPTPFERAPAPREPARDTGGPNLAFEAAPRQPTAPGTPPDPRTLKTSPPAPAPPAPVDLASGGRSPAFEAVPASVAVAQQRLSTPTIGIRPEPADTSGPVRPGGTGWNVRPREGAFLPNRKGGDTGEGPAWQTRTLPNANRSAWDVPKAPRTRGLTGRKFLGIALSVLLVAILGFAGYEWLNGRAHPDHTITTPAAVGSLVAIHAPATVAVTQQMQAVMQQNGATRVVSGVYGRAGRASLVVLLAQGPNIETTTTQFFTDFAAGLKTQGVTVSRTGMVSTTTGGSNFICSPASGPAPLTALSLCGWDDGDTIGLVVAVSGQTVGTTLSEAVAARGAGEH
ncbi:MAG: hypothetical protein WAW53_01620 [Candidatus Dormiibacterota bacterium]